jgi:hypothetical protein
MSDINKVIEKVKSLLAMSRGSANANEAATAAAMANKIIDQYRLSECDLEGTEEGHSEPIEEDSDYIYQSGKVTQWKRLLVSVLARHYGCSHWNHTDYSGGRKVSRYRLVGRKSDIGLVHYMFSWLSTECIRLSQLEAKGMGRVFVASYCEGFVNGVAQQLKASRTEAKAEASSSSIVKIDARFQDAETALYKLHNNLRVVKTASQARHNSMAFDAGQVRGKNVHLGASISAGNTRMLKA